MVRPQRVPWPSSWNHSTKGVATWLPIRAHQRGAHRHAGPEQDRRHADHRAVCQVLQHVGFIRYTNVTTSLAGSSASLRFNTAPAAGGTAIVTVANSVAVTGLTAASVVTVPTIASAAATVSGTLVNNTLRQIYANVGVAHGAAVTITAIIKICRIP